MQPAASGIIPACGGRDGVRDQPSSQMTRYLVAGGCGFIGSHVTEALLRLPQAEVVVYDNLSSGRTWHLDAVADDPRLTIVEDSLADLDALTNSLSGCAQAFHFAANPDIARAATDPAIDFWEGTYLTHNLVEACRVAGVGRITYASGSGVYGDRSDRNADECFGPLEPVSTYGASKLGCEALLSAYAHMFGISSSAFRFANVVGARQTHGVTFDFVRKLLEDPTALVILGDGEQSKSYVHVDDVVAAMLLVARAERPGFEVFNVGTDDYMTVTEIADLVVGELGLDGVEYRYSGGVRGWKGDVPIVRFDTAKIRGLGWANARTSREALLASIHANRLEARRNS
jgi:UDP-glucose 4-epimerase